MKLPFKIDNNFIKKIRFIPTEVGIHKIYLKLGDSLLTGDYLFYVNLIVIKAENINQFIN